MLFEQEANQGAAELLFQRELFRQIAADYEIGCGAIVELAEKFGSSMHAAFRRYVETHHSPLAGLVLEPSPCASEPFSYRRKEAFHSAAYTRRFGEPRCWPTVLRENPYSFVAEASGYISNMFPPGARSLCRTATTSLPGSRSKSSPTPTASSCCCGNRDANYSSIAVSSRSPDEGIRLRLAKRALPDR